MIISRNCAEKIINIGQIVLGIATSAVLPILSEPLEPVVGYYPFAVGAGLAGFYLTYSDTGLKERVWGRSYPIRIFVIFALAGMAYLYLLNADWNIDPSHGMQILKLVLYCIATLHFLALVGLIARVGGRKILERFF